MSHDLNVPAAFDTTISTTAPSSNFATPAPASTSSPEPPPGWLSKHHARRRPIRMTARKRAQQRWSALLSRIAQHMRLDDALWGAFAAHANARYKPRFVRAFEGPLRLECVGPVRGVPCGFCVDMTSPKASHILHLLHLDHEQDVIVTCDLWKSALPPHPSVWDERVDRELLCHLLFGVAPDPVHGAPMLPFRCRSAARCHKLNMPHYEAVRAVAA